VINAVAIEVVMRAQRAWSVRPAGRGVLDASHVTPGRRVTILPLRRWITIGG
jgi:hypothetical protein